MDSGRPLTCLPSPVAAETARRVLDACRAFSAESVAPGEWRIAPRIATRGAPRGAPPGARRPVSSGASLPASGSEAARPEVVSARLEEPVGGDAWLVIAPPVGCAAPRRRVPPSSSRLASRNLDLAPGLEYCLRGPAPGAPGLAAEVPLILRGQPPGELGAASPARAVEASDPPSVAVLAAAVAQALDGLLGSPSPRTAAPAPGTSGGAAFLAAVGASLRACALEGRADPEGYRVALEDPEGRDTGEVVRVEPAPAGWIRASVDAGVFEELLGPRREAVARLLLGVSAAVRGVRGGLRTLEAGTRGSRTIARLEAHLPPGAAGWIGSAIEALVVGVELCRSEIAVLGGDELVAWRFLAAQGGAFAGGEARRGTGGNRP